MLVTFDDRDGFLSSPRANGFPQVPIYNLLVRRHAKLSFFLAFMHEIKRCDECDASVDSSSSGGLDGNGPKAGTLRPQRSGLIGPTVVSALNSHKVIV